MTEFDKSRFKLDINIPEHYSIHVTDDEQVNAFATLGGNILITSAMLYELDYEEEILFVIGHEITHLDNRDPLERLLTDIPFALTLGFLGFDVNLGIDTLSSLTTSYVSKTKESDADIGGIKLLEKNGANIGCALAFFERNNNLGQNALEFFSDHPTTINRINQIKNYIGEEEIDFSQCTPLFYYDP